MKVLISALIGALGLTLVATTTTYANEPFKYQTFVQKSKRETYVSLRCYYRSLNYEELPPNIPDSLTFESPDGYYTLWFLLMAVSEEGGKKQIVTGVTKETLVNGLVLRPGYNLSAGKKKALTEELKEAVHAKCP